MIFLSIFLNYHFIQIRNVDTKVNFQVQVDVVCEGDPSNDLITQVIIWPAMKSEQFSTGLCRTWFNTNRDKSDNQDEIVDNIENDEPEEIKDLGEILEENR